jgi:DNA-directed RNA polymerase specialized sigma24 family protein
MKRRDRVRQELARPQGGGRERPVAPAALAALQDQVLGVLDPEEDESVGLSASSLRLAEVLEVLRALPELERIVLCSVSFGQVPLVRLARRLQLSSPTVTAALARARKALGAARVGR